MCKVYIYKQNLICDMNIRDFIQQNYDKLRKQLSYEWYKMKGNAQFDADIFHDTLMKTIYNLENEDVDGSIYAYIKQAFINNVYRESQYSYNKQRTEVEDMNNIDIYETYQQCNIDINNLVNNIKRAFGKQTTICFILWCKGYTIAEIQKHYGINNLYHKFSKIKNFIKNTYDI